MVKKSKNYSIQKSIDNLNNKQDKLNEKNILQDY